VGTVGFLGWVGWYTCVGCFGRISNGAPVGFCHVGDGGTCSPDTVTCLKKNAARGIKLGSAALQPKP